MVYFFTWMKTIKTKVIYILFTFFVPFFFLSSAGIRKYKNVNLYFLLSQLRNYFFHFSHFIFISYFFQSSSFLPFSLLNDFIMFHWIDFHKFFLVYYHFLWGFCFDYEIVMCRKDFSQWRNQSRIFIWLLKIIDLTIEQDIGLEIFFVAILLLDGIILGVIFLVNL